jgi:Fur family ferric uptake transcriptional regulator
MSSIGLTARLTSYQERILETLEKLDEPISAQDLHIQMRSIYKSLGLSTVYRGLEVLKLRGLVQKRTSIDGEFLYSSVQKHQHYFTCLQCGDSIDIHACPVCELEAELQRSPGISLRFQIFYHSLEFFGLCRFCQGMGLSS